MNGDACLSSMSEDDMARDLVRRLRALAKQQHDDLSVADKAAEELERLGARLNLLQRYMGGTDYSESESRDL